MISTVIHSYPRFSTVHHGTGNTVPHHTTTVFPVGCGECVWIVDALTATRFHTPQSTTVRSAEWV